MWRYFISILFVLAVSVCRLQAQDTIMFPQKFRIGVEVIGLSKYFYEKETAGIEAFFSADLTEKYSAIFIAGRSDYSSTLYRDETFMMYDFSVKGLYLKAGVDVNMLDVKKAAGKYSFGLGARYGITGYTYNVAGITRENYWGQFQTSIPERKALAHYFEVVPSIRAEIIKNFSLGWAISLRKMIYSGTEKDMKPVYVPGYGNGAKSISLAVSYFVIWHIPYKERRVIIPPKVQREIEED